MKYIGKELPVLPSLHDLRVDKITFEDNILRFFFNDIAEFDTIIYQEIKANVLELEMTICDYDFCLAKVFDYESLTYDDEEIDYKKQLKTTIYSINEFLKETKKEDFFMYILDVATSYKKVIIQTDTELGHCDIELCIKSIEYKWD